MSDPTPLPQREDNEDWLGLCHAVLFDLDGTLADTPPDLAAAVNKMHHDRGLEMVPFEKLRPLASAGARGLICGGFGIGPDHHEFASMREEFLANYEADLCIETTLFPGIPELLDELDARGVRWGIVTNKVARLTEPLIAQLGLEERAGCVVSGDTTPHSKPHPAPLLYAARALDTAAERIVYVGDDLRDVQAGFAAGMKTVAAAYGYCGDDIPPTQWHAQHVVQSPAELQRLLRDIG
ncbi:MAG: Similar to phosphoglycolate phosphatase, clustered with ubiquinone biosynthesis SAM-dependent O-methyltransferase [uncultured Paraburkholderia sp.]|nr:MAG: Similar to phosphoglycolate phosphatase, clustered with ubiquinone biosynthesis SAM-dependent O-methyltransferase [uncultured Paraburkholderia sp.]CAH2791223.1 MAG: Similar to phosphoglycolate phosphatase, clustered with ubiquinone biosynthesis SAM-dependent O-methyltransferase [uncultured Paraburkholderia sp.]CAH2925249.1 MAG: Similar to phosphoglycolate phosphatase, clustered with ubiquinone biosynthesis SAM-dependent O-methyltransferase [uncultured Paraburkholderia sp.]CAH2926815.1 MA